MSEEIKDYTIEDVQQFLDENFGENDWFKAVEKFGLELFEEALNIGRPSEEEIQADMDAYYKEMTHIHEETNMVNNEAIEYVKTMIDYDFENIEEYLDNNDWWRSMGYVEVEKSDYENGFYPSHDFYTEKVTIETFFNNTTLPLKEPIISPYYMRQDDNNENTCHSLVWQQSGGYGVEDSYSGFILFPLTDGRYWKIKFEC